MELVIAVDIGSSSVRCSAYSLEKGGTVSSLDNCLTSRAVRSVQPNTGKIQLQIPENGNQKELFDIVDECIDELLEILRKEFKQIHIVGIGISSFVMNLVGIAADGSIVGSEASISYACNAPQVAQQCRNLRSRLCEDDIQSLYQNTGAPIHSAYAISQFLDIYGTDDNPNNKIVRESVHKWQTLASICLCRWTGETFLPISLSEASWTGLLNFRTCQYEQRALDVLPEDCQKALPPLADFSDETHPQLQLGIQETRYRDGGKNQYWERWPELRGTHQKGGKGCRLFLGLGDGACANIGSKCSTTSRIAVTIGTSAAARICLPLAVCGSTDTPSDTIQIPKGLFCYRINRSYVLVGGALTDGGSVIEWVSNLLNLSSPQALNECLEKVENLVEEDYICSCEGQSTSSSFTVIPFLSGERSTGFRDNATCAMLGISRDTSSLHMVKSCLEGVTLRLNAILKLILKSVKEYEKAELKPCVVASGKALESNALWRQLLSDCSGLEVIMDKDTQEGTSRGIALAIAVALQTWNASTSGESSDVSSKAFTEEMLRPSIHCKPNQSGKSYWRQAEVSQEAFLEVVSPLY